MSGKLVGEVLAASSALKADGLSARGFYALIAIAEKCHPATRQGTVRWDHICDGLYGASLRTAKRAVVDLQSVGLLRVVKRGFNNQHGRVCAPVYEIAQLHEQDTQMTQSPSERTGHPGDAFVGGRTGQNGERTGHPDVPLNGSIDGKEGGLRKSGTSPAQPVTTAPPIRCRKHPDGNSAEPCRDCMKVRQHQEEHARAADEEKRRQGRERRAAIEACGLCDDFGWVLDVEPLKRCKHSTVTTNAGN